MSDNSTCFNEKEISELTKTIRSEYPQFLEQYPSLMGEAPILRQPIHSVYGGAQLWKWNTCEKIGALARKSLEEFAPNHKVFAEALGLECDEALSKKIYDRVKEKLLHEPVEDFRIDFEDGYGTRPDTQEDEHAQICAKETSKAMREKSLPPFIGIRIKAINMESMNRSLRTLGLFIGELLNESQGVLPPNFVVTLPKVMLASQVETLNAALTLIEQKHQLQAGSIPIELMVETTQSIFNKEGYIALPKLIAAANGRCRGAHFGTYDYTAACDIVANCQTMKNPVCDFAKHIMQVGLAGKNIQISDGATNIMPVPSHKGSVLSAAQVDENKKSVHNAWRKSYEDISHSLNSGFYQGWDLHPAQLPIRYATVYHFFLKGFDTTSARLKNFIEKAAQATLVGDVFDDAATGQGLLNYFLRALNCGAITENEATHTGLSIKEIGEKSFMKIVANRTKNFS